METGINFVDCFQIDVISNVLAFLNDPADLIRASAVSRSWRHFVIANGLCKKLWLRKAPPAANIAFVADKNDGTIVLLDLLSKNPINWETHEREHKICSSLLQLLANPIISPKDCIAFVIGASSTDRDPAENIVNTLNPIDRFSHGASYWSSKGQSDPNVPENILYRLKSGVCILTEIDIRPFEVFWEPGSPVYSAKSVRFRMGHAKSIAEFFTNDVTPVNQPSVDKYVWTYTSPEFPMTQESCLQQFKLPEPVVCIGGFLQIELLGRAQREEIDELFYICLGHVRALGHALEPALILEMFPSGEHRLKYHPIALNFVLRRFSDEGFLSIEEPEDTAEEDTEDGETMPMAMQIFERLFEGEDA